ncbi:hypothetical protein ENUP19_0047G0130 [Entamoeba nuttalli]|uniref:Protein kinase domain-containing protein n=1 Tax=Entamoeba nuttalli TaxID=412467 RepID=A0ABQ0DB49_9EUKA
MNIIIFLVIYQVIASWYTDKNNHIYYGLIGELFSDVGYDVSKGLFSDVYVFTFSGDCCYKSRDYYYIDPYFSTNSKVCYVQSTSKLKQLYLLEDSPTVQWKFQLEELPSSIQFILENTRSTIDTGYETSLQVGSRPVRFFIHCYERMTIHYQSEDRPYIYLEGNNNIQNVTILNEIDTIKYVFSGISIDTIVGYGDNTITSICSIGSFNRFVQHESTLTLKQDCSCSIHSDSSSVNFHEFTMNYPDCLYNNSLFYLTILQRQVTISFREDAPLLWKGIIFEPRFGLTIIQIATSTKLYLTELTELPTTRLYVIGKIHFKSVLFPQTNVIHCFTDISYDQANFTSQKGKIVFVGTNTFHQGVEKICENGNRTRFGYLSSLGCTCQYTTSFIQDDCFESSLYETNMLNLVLTSQETTYSSIDGSYWNSITTSTVSYLKGTIKSNICTLNGKTTIYGKLSCNTIYLNGNVTVLGSDPLKSNQIIIQKDCSLIGNIQSIKYEILSNCNVIFENSFSSNIVLIIHENSFLTFKRPVIIEKITTGINVQIKAERIEFVELITDNFFSLNALTCTIQSGTIRLNYVVLTNQMVIKKNVNSISIESITFKSIGLPLLSLEPTSNELLIKTIPQCISCSNTLFLEANSRKIVGVEPSLYSCDQQLIVLNKLDNFIGCKTLQLYNKKCEYGDPSITPLYSCPCHGSSDVYCTTIIYSSSYQLSDDEYPNEIEILKTAELKVKNKEFILKTNANVEIKGSLNNIVFSPSDSTIQLSVSQSNMIYASTGYGISYSKGNLITSSTEELCLIVYVSNNEAKCIKCKIGEDQNGNCLESIKIEHCRALSSIDKRCDFCDYYYYSSLGVCSKCHDEHCKSCNETNCFVCDENYVVNKNECSPVTTCDYYSNGVCYECPEKSFPINGECQPCKVTGCLKCTTATTCSVCDVTNGYFLYENECKFVKGIITNSHIISCPSQFYLLNDNCISCSGRHCIICTAEICYNCQEGYVLNNAGECVPQPITCNANNSRCINCQEFEYLNYTECVECSSHCTKCTNDGNCVSCESGYVLEQEFDDFNGYKVKCKLFNSTTNHCELLSEGKCLTCKDNYYTSSYQCLECDYKCKKCTSRQDYCYECNDGFFIENDHCVSSKDYVANCKRFIGSVCIKCNDGYFIQSSKCVPCSPNCDICYQENICSTCITDFFVNETYQCERQINLSNCIGYGEQGCIECEQGYYINGKRCSTCSSKTNKCSECDMNYGYCIGCEKDFILIEKECIYFEQIKHCLGSEGSKCTSCEYWFQPNESGQKCDLVPVWWNFVVVIIIIDIIIKICVIMGTALIQLIVKRIYLRKMEYEENHNYTKFQIKYSNINFKYVSKSHLVMNINKLTFGCETQPLPVETESRELFCIGNLTKKTIKIFLNAIEKKEKYEFKINPSEIILKNGEACEFEAILIPHCSCTISDYFQVSSSYLNGGNSNSERIGIEFITEISTKFDPDELIEIKKIGEGSFGIVYLGKFRGNKVAIKKMKQINCKTEEEQIEEFSYEVSMLDKFRSDYIIHFYGAVMIPGKICMVTEYAEYGSLNNVMKNYKKENKELNCKIKLKIFLDAAKGIQYLHQNSILHRDIKPDNILILSLDNDISINAKLTDFGSSRNVNSLLKNITFTKGIGTPAFMAPEILNKDHYNFPADIFAFAVTMYQLLSWNDPYPNDKFKYPWNIASFIMNGNRLPKVSSITDEQFSLIENCWKQNPKDRYTINVVVETLEHICPK